ncbi:MAG: hypothetical protein ABJA82_05470 [Myxococcales bacterium]
MGQPTRVLMTALVVVAFVATFLNCGAGPFAHAQQDDEDDPFAARAPVVRWRTLKTPHFRIHFYESERYIAERAAGIAERAFDSLTRYLDWLPRGRIDITLVDATDAANGFASSLPSNFIYGYGVPPEPLSSLNDFDDWLNVLISHELTHVVHLDTILGLPRLVDIVFGKITAPNLVQPNWFIEGLAVLNESRVTTGGRIRSALYDMYLRSAVLEGRFHDISAVSNGPLAFPQGEAAYLYGGHFLKYLEDRFGPEKLTEISHRYGRRLLPFGINRVAREVYGERYDQLWDDWHEALKRRYALQVDEVTRRGLTTPTRLTFDGDGAVGGVPSPGLAPRFFPQDRGIMYLRATRTQRPAYVLLDPAHPEQEDRRRELFEAHGAGAASPTPDGRGLVFQQVAPMPLPRRVGGADSTTWEDLFHLDLESGEVRRLTYGRRTHQPDVSPDGRRVVCTIGSTTGSHLLAVLPLEGGKPQVLVPNKLGEIAYSPAWSPDGKQIAYSRFKPGGYHDIHIFDLATGTDHPLMVDRAMDIDPRFSPDGRFVLWSSDRTGIYNVFAWELETGHMFQVTNVLSGAFQPVVSPDRRTLVFTGFSAVGYDLYSIPYAPDTWKVAEPFVNSRDDAAVIETATPTVAAARESDYQAWKYLYPRSWGVPTVSSDDLGLGPAVGLTLNVSDPASMHGLTLSALVPTAGDPSLSAYYNYYRFWPLLSLAASRAAATGHDLSFGGHQQDYRQHQFALSGSVGLPVLRRVDSSGDLSLSYQYLQYGPADQLPIADPTGEITIPPETGPNTNFSLGWSYSNAHAWGLSVSNQEGRSLGLSLTVSDPSIGSKFHTTVVNWNWREYFTPPWARLHALAVLYAGGVGIGDKRSSFALGGFEHQDLVRALFYQRRQCCLFLRGYPVGLVQGDQFHLLSMEYRAPLLLLESGYSTFPIYLRRVQGALFTDFGNAFYGDFTRHGWRVGSGVELRLDFKVGYYFESQVQFGVAKGFSKDGVTDYYWVTSFPIF